MFPAVLVLTTHRSSLITENITELGVVMLPIVEIFGPTIQGEGRRVGHPSYFIRFGGCNLRCQGFGCEYRTPDGDVKLGCDTYYAVDPLFRKNWKIITDYYEIIEELHNLGFDENKIDKPDIVITGGEPTIYWKNEEFQKLLIYLISRGIKVTIETNASIDIEFTKPYQKEIMFSMSVKLSNSGEPEYKRININNINNILENTNDSYFKFVVDKNTDFSEIEDLLKQVPYYADVYLMPMGETREHIAENAEYVADLCIKHGFKYSPRLHIDIWGNKKGV